MHEPLTQSSADGECDIGVTYIWNTGSVLFSAHTNQICELQSKKNWTRSWGSRLLIYAKIKAICFVLIDLRGRSKIFCNTRHVIVRLESGEILRFKLFSMEWCSEYGWGDTCVTPAIKADNWRLQKTTISYLMHVKLCTALMDVGLWYKTVHTWTVLVRD